MKMKMRCALATCPSNITSVENVHSPKFRAKQPLEGLKQQQQILAVTQLGDLSEWGVGAMAANPDEHIPEAEETSRLAVLDLDWDRIRAADILVVLRSFLDKVRACNASQSLVELGSSPFLLCKCPGILSSTWCPPGHVLRPRNERAFWVVCRGSASRG